MYEALLVALGCALMLFCAVGCSAKVKEKQSPPGGKTTTTEPKRQAPPEEKNEKAPEPKKEAPERDLGAMCYDISISLDRGEYVCPVCGDKTLYANDMARDVSWKLASCRREMKEIAKTAAASIILDESSLCGRCKPHAEARTLQLVVISEDGQTHTTSGISQQDLRILRDFLNGKLTATAFNDAEIPVSDSIERLRGLLGARIAS